VTRERDRRSPILFSQKQCGLLLLSRCVRDTKTQPISSQPIKMDDPMTRC
jgi:hypothetical protein